MSVSKSLPIYCTTPLYNTISRVPPSLICSVYISFDAQIGISLVLANIKETSTASNIITSEGGAVVGKNVQLVCPPGAVDCSVNVTITSVDPSNYYGLIVQTDL